MMKTLARLGNYIATERNFLAVSTVGLGIPAAAIAVWGLREYGEFVVGVAALFAVLGAYVWGLIMWRVMFRDIYARIETLKQKADSAKSAEHRNA
jgi:hypothetical protein